MARSFSAKCFPVVPATGIGNSLFVIIFGGLENLN